MTCIKHLSVIEQQLTSFELSGLPVNRASPSASSLPLGAAAQVKGRDDVNRALVLMLQSVGMVSDGAGVLDWQTLSGRK